MHILHLYKNYWPIVGGIENHLRLLAENQAKMGHRVTVLVVNTERRTVIEEINGVRVIKAARLAAPASTPLSAALPLWVRRLQPDVAHLHFPYPFGEVAHFCLGRARGTIITYHSDIIRQRALLRLYKPLMMRILDAANRIVATSPQYITSSEVLRRFQSKCVVIPFGIEQARFQTPHPATQRILAEYGPEPLLLFVGVLRYYKGLTYLLRAMPQIPARLLIVGDGPMAPTLREEAQRLGLGERVVFLGRVGDEDLPAYYQAARVFVLPACERSEAFGIVQLEALASGVPIVSTELGTGTSYVNLNGESGLVVPTRDPQALAEAINRLLGDTSLYTQLAEGARRRASLFEAGRMVAQIEALYRHVLAEV